MSYIWLLVPRRMAKRRVAVWDRLGLAKRATPQFTVLGCRVLSNKRLLYLNMAMRYPLECAGSAATHGWVVMQITVRTRGHLRSPVIVSPANRTSPCYVGSRFRRIVTRKKG